MEMTKQLSVFVVEDDNFFSELIQDFLKEKKTLKVSGFSSAESCLEKLNENPDIIVLDYHLDKENPSAMNGLDALKEIRKTLPDTKVIILSAQHSLNTAAELLNLGAFDYVIKNNNAIRVLDKIMNKAIDDLQKLGNI
jgi:two-component system OmpR family response regulator